MRRADTSICGMTRWYWIRSNKREREIEMSHIERVKEVRAIVEPTTTAVSLSWFPSVRSWA